MYKRGVINCNPGNIPLSISPLKGELTPSEDLKFKQFESMEWGYRAMFLIINNYSELHSINTLNRIISRWSPRSCRADLNTYIRSVAKRLGCTSVSHIDTRDRDMMIALVSSMAWIESGEKAHPAEVEAGWELFSDSLC